MCSLGFPTDRQISKLKKRRIALKKMIQAYYLGYFVCIMISAAEALPIAIFTRHQEHRAAVRKHVRADVSWDFHHGCSF
jgi:hypothetical protein